MLFRCEYGLNKVLVYNEFHWVSFIFSLAVASRSRVAENEPRGFATPGYLQSVLGVVKNVSRVVKNEAVLILLWGLDYTWLWFFVCSGHCAYVRGVMKAEKSVLRACGLSVDHVFGSEIFKSANERSPQHYCRMVKCT